MPHKISIIDKDGNQSEITLPDFAMDTTQERLIKSVQALGKLNPKTAKAYEDLIKETKNAVTATEDASDQQKKDAKALQDTVQNVGDKQVNALRQFRMNFADRVGKDMRDTFTSGGNILTAAIKTATVGLAAGAGLLYKTFMDTSDAFRQLAQSGLGGAGASGTEAQDAVANLTRLGMSAGEAASMITSFGRASAVLGKANFSKFISGVANAGSFAADLGLTLEEAAEYAAEEVEMRQAGLVGRLRLDSAQSQSVMEAIQATQLLAGIMGKSMKDINASGKNFVENNANLANFLNTLPDHMRDTVMAQFTSFGKEAGAIGENTQKVFETLMRGSLLLEPMQDANVRAFYAMGTGGQKLADIFVDAGRRTRATGEFTDAQRKDVLLRAMDVIKRYNMEEAGLISTLIGGGNQLAEGYSNASTEVAQGADNLIKYFDAVAAGRKAENDPMVQAAANFQTAINRVTGAFTTQRNLLLGQFADPLNAVFNQLNETPAQMAEYNKQRAAAIDADKTLNDEEKAKRKAELSTNPFQALYDGLGRIADSFMKKFFPNINAAGDGVGEFVTLLTGKIDEFMTGISDFIDGLEGDTFGAKIYDALGKGLSFLFSAGLSIAWGFAKNVIAEHWGKIMLYMGALMGASLIKTFVLSKVAAMAGGQITGAGRTAASAVSSAGNTLAAVIRRVAGQIAAAGGVSGPMGGGGSRRGRGGRGGRLTNILGKASLVGIGTSMVTGVAANELEERGHNKTAAAVDTAGMIAGAAGLGAMIGTPFGGVGAIPGAAIGAAIGGVGALGLGLYQNWNTWFGSDEAQEAIAEQGQQAIESIDETGMAAMAMDPIHIANVGYALDQFNKVSVDNIAAGLSEFNPKLAELFTNIQNVRTQFVDVVSTRLAHLLNIITGLNDQGLRLPATTEHLTGLANKIATMPVDAIVKLADAFTALTRALRGFGDLTTSNVFSRMWDSFSGKQDATEDVIKVLNNFSDPKTGVNSERLLQASEALMAFNAGMLGYARPVEVTRTNVTAAQQSADSVNNAAAAGMNPQTYNPFAKTEEQLRLIKNEMIASNDALRKIRDHVNPNNPQR